MNFYTVALFLLLGQMLKQNGKKTDNVSGVSPLDLLGDDVKSVVTALKDLTAGNGNKTDALLALATNPTVMQLVGKLLGQKGEQSATPTAENVSASVGATDVPPTNSEGYVFKDNPSKDSKDFFRPVENIADEEVKHKLYWFYDNWYL